MENLFDGLYVGEKLLKLHKIQTKNYGNLKEAILDRLAILNILIRPTNYGKTHILKFVRIRYINQKPQSIEWLEEKLKDIW